MATINDALAFISEADSDDLDRIIGAIRSRQKINRMIDTQKASALLTVGATVSIGSNISPKYFTGVKAEVLAINGTKADLLVDQRTVDYRASRYLRHVTHENPNMRKMTVPVASIEI